MFNFGVVNLQASVVYVINELESLVVEQSSSLYSLISILFLQ